MVLKSGKYGVYSGNTLRASTSKYLRQYKKQSCLVRRIIREPRIEGGQTRARTVAPVLGELDVHSENVTFSLNKKGRWSLPSLLRNNIISGDHGGEEYGVQMIEYHKLKRSANCIGFCSTDGPVRQATKTCKRGKRNKRRRRRQGYMSAGSFLTVKKTKSEENEEQTQEETESEQLSIEEVPAQVRYEVFYPTSVTSSIAHNPKYILKTHDKFSDSYNCRYWNSRSTRRRRKIANEIWEELSALDNGFDDSEEEEFKNEDDTLPIHRHSEFVLSDILDVASRAEKLLNVKNKKRTYSLSSDEDAGSNKPTKRLIFMGADERGTSTRPKQTTKQASKARAVPVPTEPVPVRVILPSDHVSPHSLEVSYGRNYTECECFPRKFMLDISDKLSARDGMGSKHRYGPIACLVFVHDVENEINNLQEDVYKVTLNAELNSIESVKIETIFDYMECTVDSVIDRALFFIETLPDHGLESRREIRQILVPSDNLEECTPWKSRSYKPDVRYLLEALLNGNAELEQAKDLGFQVVSRFDEGLYERQTDVASPKDRFCDICYEELCGDISATSMIACGHWFCDRCWRDHLDTRVKDGKTKLTCPEYQCNQTLDPGTLMTLIDVKSVIKYAECCHDAKVEQQEVTKWCPNPKCGCVLKIESVGQKNVRCQCGRKVCFDCLGEAHWPATCTEQHKYIKKLKDNGDESILPLEAVSAVTVHGKRCPSCSRIIEKDGGCPYMACVCGKQFCWGCMKDWNTNTHSAECYTFGQRNKHGTKAHEVKADPSLTRTKKGSRWYSMALYHRVQQHPVKIRKMKKAIPSLTKSIKTYIGKSLKKGEHVIIDFESPHITFQFESDKVQYLLVSMVDLYLELHKLMEHTSVLLDSMTMAQNGSPALAHVLSRLDTFCTFIYELMLSGADRNAKETLAKITELRNHSRRSIKCLVRFVKTITCST